MRHGGECFQKTPHAFHQKQPETYLHVVHTTAGQRAGVRLVKSDWITQVEMGLCKGCGGRTLAEVGAHRAVELGWCGEEKAGGWFSPGWPAAASVARERAAGGRTCRERSRGPQRRQTARPVEGRRRGETPCTAPSGERRSCSSGGTRAGGRRRASGPETSPGRDAESWGAG